MSETPESTAPVEQTDPAASAPGDETTSAGSVEAGETVEGGEPVEPAAEQSTVESFDGADEASESPTAHEADEEEADEAEGEEAPRSASSRRAELEREGEVAADFLESLLDICDLDGDLDVDIDGDRAAVAIVDSDEGRVPRRLVGQNGQVLEALQELTRLAVQSTTGIRTRLMLDVAGHRATRRSELVALAKDAIDAVRDSGEKRALDPMSAFERKVVHDEVLAAGLVSESEGAEPRRFVVIHPA